MEIIFFAFVAAWALGGVLSGSVWRYGKHWPPMWRVLAASSVAAVFFAPSLLVGHGGAAPFPFLGTLIFVEPELFLSSPKFALSITVIPLALTWLFCLMVFFARCDNAMLCDNCRERPATMHITVQVNEEAARKRDFCVGCFPPDLSKAEYEATVRHYFFGSSPSAPLEPNPRHVMKQCAFCGGEYPEEMMECPLDRQPLDYDTRSL